MYGSCVLSLPRRPNSVYTARFAAGNAAVPSALMVSTCRPMQHCLNVIELFWLLMGLDLTRCGHAGRDRTLTSSGTVKHGRLALLINRFSSFTSPQKMSVHLLRRLQDNSPTNQLAVSQVADWSTRGLYSQLADSKLLLNNRQIIIYLYAKQIPNSKPNAMDY